MNDGMDEMKGDIPFVKPFVKPCPFCGSEATVFVNALKRKIFSCGNGLCVAYKLQTSFDEWQSRPIEDALRAQVEKAEEMVARLIEAGDNHIHMAIASVRQQDEYYALVAEWECRNDKPEEAK